MSGSTNVENNNAYIACTELKPMEKEKKLEIKIGHYGKKGQEGDYVIAVADGKIMHPDDSAKSKLDNYKKNVKAITKYKNKKQVKEDDLQI